MKSIQTRPKTRWSTFRILGTVVALGLLIYLLSLQGWEKIIEAATQIPLWRLALAMVLMVLSRMAVAARWHVLLRAADMNVSYWQSLRITLAGLFASNFLPTTIGGDVVRLAGAVRLKFDAAVCTASLAVDRLVGLTGMLVMVPFGLTEFIATRSQTGVIFFIPYPFLLSVSFSNLWKKVWLKTLIIIHRILDALKLWLNKPKSLFGSFGFTWLNMIFLFLVMSFLMGGMGETIPFWLIGGLYSLAYFITLLPFTINGYGLQEISLTFVFSNIAGASISSSLALALLFRTMMMLASLPGAFFLPGIISREAEPFGVVATESGGEAIKDNHSEHKHA